MMDNMDTVGIVVEMVAKMMTYRIDVKFGGNFNLASWRLMTKSPN